jgi:hypothetical protein
MTVKTYDNNFEKHIWCRTYCGMSLNIQGYKIDQIFPCKYGSTCRGAHTKDEIVIKDEIKHWRKCDKSHLNLLSIYDNIIQAIESSKDMVISQKYRAQILNINKMRFDELLMFWFDITCYHRRISKELPTKKSWQNPKSKPQPMEGYNFKDDVPTFYLENEEDVWSLERTIHMCEKHLGVLTNPRTSVKNICIGDVNCKEGIHNREELVCIDNMLNGNCSCELKETFNEKKIKLTTEIKEIEKKLNPSTDEDGFSVFITKKVKDELIQKLKEKKIESTNLFRLVHLTEFGLIPLSERQKEREKTQPVAVENIQVVETKKVMKKKY